jgi:hypothetical protein
MFFPLFCHQTIINAYSVSAQNASLFRFHVDTTQLVFGIAPSDFELGVATKLQSETFCMLLQRIISRLSSNKNVDVDIASFHLDSDSSEGTKG